MKYVHSFQTQGVWLQVDYQDFWELASDLQLRDDLPPTERPTSQVLALRDDGVEEWQANAEPTRRITPLIDRFITRSLTK